MSTEKIESVLLVVGTGLVLTNYPSKSTLTGTTTFPVLRTGTILLTLTTSKVMSTEKVASVLLVFETEIVLS
jgi:hypothetical protein